MLKKCPCYLHKKFSEDKVSFEETKVKKDCDSTYIYKNNNAYIVAHLQTIVTNFTKNLLRRAYGE